MTELHEFVALGLQQVKTMQIVGRSLRRPMAHLEQQCVDARQCFRHARGRIVWWEQQWLRDGRQVVHSEQRHSGLVVRSWCDIQQRERLKKAHVSYLWHASKGSSVRLRFVEQRDSSFSVAE